MAQRRSVRDQLFQRARRPARGPHAAARRGHDDQIRLRRSRDVDRLDARLQRRPRLGGLEVVIELRIADEQNQRDRGQRRDVPAAQMEAQRAEDPDEDEQRDVEIDDRRRRDARRIEDVRGDGPEQDEARAGHRRCEVSRIDVARAVEDVGHAQRARDARAEPLRKAGERSKRRSPKPGPEPRRRRPPPSQRRVLGSEDRRRRGGEDQQNVRHDERHNYPDHDGIDHVRS